MVEDEKPIREMLAFNLGRAGYQVLQAADGREARLDILMLDVLHDLALLKPTAPNAGAGSAVPADPALAAALQSRLLKGLLDGVAPWPGHGSRRFIIPTATTRSPEDPVYLLTLDLAPEAAAPWRADPGLVIASEAARDSVAELRRVRYMAVGPVMVAGPFAWVYASSGMRGPPGHAPNWMGYPSASESFTLVRTLDRWKTLEISGVAAN